MLLLLDMAVSGGGENAAINRLEHISDSFAQENARKQCGGRGESNFHLECGGTPSPIHPNSNPAIFEPTGHLQFSLAGAVLRFSRHDD